MGSMGGKKEIEGKKIPQTRGETDAALPAVLHLQHKQGWGMTGGWRGGGWVAVGNEGKEAGCAA